MANTPDDTANDTADSGTTIDTSTLRGAAAASGRTIGTAVECWPLNNDAVYGPLLAEQFDLHSVPDVPSLLRAWGAEGLAAVALALESGQSARPDTWVEAARHVPCSLGALIGQWEGGRAAARAGGAGRPTTR